MGVMQNNPPERRKAKGRRRGKQFEPADWSDIDPGTIVDLICLIQSLDGAIRFGRSRDGEVFSLGFYIGDERFTEWIRNDDQCGLEFARILDEIAEDFQVPSDFS